METRLRPLPSQRGKRSNDRDDVSAVNLRPVDISKQVGDTNHLQLFASEAAAEAWFRENDPEGVAFEYEVQTNC
jgi:hypothetical protein